LEGTIPFPTANQQTSQQPPAAPPWGSNDGHEQTRPTKTGNKHNNGNTVVAPREGIHDGIDGICPTPFSQKRQNHQSSQKFPPAPAPAAKRTVLRATLEKMKQTQQGTKSQQTKIAINKLDTGLIKSTRRAHQTTT
jgi:hypothetical protein